MEPTQLQRDTIVDRLSKSDSELKTYQHLFVGSTSLVDLLRYELLTFFLGSLPGAVGFFLRKTFYRYLFSSAGKGILIGPHVTLRCPVKITLGNSVYIDNNAVLDAKGLDSRIDLGNSVLVGRNTIVSCASATIKLGDDVSIGPHCHVRAGLCPIEVGSHVTIGSHSVIISGNPGYSRLDVPMKSQIGSTQGIIIGCDVWIGVGARITDGVKIGSGCVIGAGAVVNADIPDFSIAAGVPAKIIGHRKGKKSF